MPTTVLWPVQAACIMASTLSLNLTYLYTLYTSLVVAVLYLYNNNNNES